MPWLFLSTVYILMFLLANVFITQIFFSSSYYTSDDYHHHHHKHHHNNYHHHTTTYHHNLNIGYVDDIRGSCSCEYNFRSVHWSVGSSKHPNNSISCHVSVLCMSHVSFVDVTSCRRKCNSYLVTLT